jgi:hypothetical protein
MFQAIGHYGIIHLAKRPSQKNESIAEEGALVSQTETTFRELIGHQLSAVTFVQDYLQLAFDGPVINVYNPLTVETPTITVWTWEDQLRNVLCGQITKRVADVAVILHDQCRIVFTDGSIIRISLREDDYTGPEGLFYHGFQGNASGVL